MYLHIIVTGFSSSFLFRYHPRVPFFSASFSLGAAFAFFEAKQRAYFDRCLEFSLLSLHIIQEKELSASYAICLFAYSGTPSAFGFSFLFLCIFNNKHLRKPNAHS